MIAEEFLNPALAPVHVVDASPSSQNSTRIIRFGNIEREIAAADCRLRQVADPLFAERFRNAFAGPLQERASVTGKRIPVLSLDVFDTFLLRNDKSEIRRFLEIAERMAAGLSKSTGRAISAADALMARYTGTLASYRMSKPVLGCREGSIVEIHSLASRLLTGSADDAQRLIDIELDYERENLTVHPLLLEVAERHVREGGKLLLLSDMYLHASQIRRLVEALGIDSGLIHALISSGDEKVSKRSGGIFRIAERAMDAPPEAFVHAGDSFLGDYKRPRERGWGALHLPVSDRERARRRLCDAQTRQHLWDMYGLSLDKVAKPD